MVDENIYKYENKEIQNEKALLQYYLLKLGEVKFQMNELDKYVNGRGITVVKLALEFREFNELIEKTENKLIEIKKRFLGNNTISFK